MEDNNKSNDIRELHLNSILGRRVVERVVKNDKCLYEFLIQGHSILCGYTQNYVPIKFKMFDLLTVLGELSPPPPSSRNSRREQQSVSSTKGQILGGRRFLCHQILTLR